jgi:hypothetical protein
LPILPAGINRYSLRSWSPRRHRALEELLGFLEASLAAGERDEHFVAALRAAAPHPRETEVQVAATEKLADYLADYRTPESVTFFVSFGIKLFELGEKPLDDAVQW